MKIAFFILLFSTNTLAADFVYIQAIKANLKKDPIQNSESVTEVIRGDRFEVIHSDGNWLQVSAHGKIGWINKLLTSKQKPVGSAEILNSGKIESPAKSSRKRSSDYSVSAATRGLSASERTRNGENLYRSDVKAIENLESKKVSQEELEEFEKIKNGDPKSK